MNFELDKQTLNDLEIFRDEKSSNSIFQFFNLTRTSGGKDYLHEMMKNPLMDIKRLKERSQLINYLKESDFHLSINHNQFDLIVHYFRASILELKPHWIEACYDIISYKIKPSNDYYLIKTGIINLLYLFKHLSVKLNEYQFPSSFSRKIEKVNQVVRHDDFIKYFQKDYKLNFIGVNKLDVLFRKTHFKTVNEIIDIVHELDAYTSIAKAAKVKRLVFAEYINSENPIVEIENLYHPNIEKPVPYSIDIKNKNLCFLTGPNMAGKSTFLKSTGLAIYLSHIGFPVPASKMRTSIFNGIVTTINLADNLGKGYSHFYTEVKRVKETAIKLRTNKKLFVIFDELFRGTNVKDAFDASLAIIKAFSEIKSSSFFVSTHITEIAEEIKSLNSVNFKYFDSLLVKNKPVYSYKIYDGVSHERLGLHIVKNEGIFEILESIKQ